MIAGIVVFTLPINVINANAAAGALEFFPENAGTASAVVGSVRYGCGAASGFCVWLDARRHGNADGDSDLGLFRSQYSFSLLCFAGKLSLRRFAARPADTHLKSCVAVLRH